MTRDTGHVKRTCHVVRHPGPWESKTLIRVQAPVIVEAKVADDLLIGRSLVLTLAPEQAELTGE